MIDPLIHTDINAQCWPMVYIFHYFVWKSRLCSVPAIRFMLTAYIAYMACLKLSSLHGDNIGVHIIFLSSEKMLQRYCKNQHHTDSYFECPFLSTSQKIAICHLKTLRFCVFSAEASCPFKSSQLDFRRNHFSICILLIFCIWSCFTATSTPQKWHRYHPVFLQIILLLSRQAMLGWLLYGAQK